MTEISIDIICELCDMKINSITMKEEDYEIWAEQYGHGSECKEDYCPKCGDLGIALVFDKDPNLGVTETVIPNV